MRYLGNTSIKIEPLKEYDSDNETGKDYLLYKNKIFGILISTGIAMLPVEFILIDEKLMIKSLVELTNINLDNCLCSIRNKMYFHDDELVLTIVDNSIVIEEEHLLAFYWNDITSLFIQN